MSKPYEPKNDRKRRLWSNFSLCVIIGLFIFGIVLIFLPNNYGKKYYFESTTTEMRNFSEIKGETNEFFEMYTAMLDPTNEFEMDNGFADRFPTVAKMLDMNTEIYNADKPYIHYGGKHMAVSQCFYSTNENVKTLDVALFGFETSRDSTTASIEMNEIVRFSLVYNTGYGTINYTKYDKQNYSMQLNSFTVTLSSGTFKGAGYTLTLDSTEKLGDAEKLLIEETVVDVVNNAVHSPTVTHKDGVTIISLSQKAGDFPEKTAKYKFDMAGDAPELFKNFVITAEIADGTLDSDIEFSFTIS